MKKGVRNNSRFYFLSVMARIVAEVLIYLILLPFHLTSTAGIQNPYTKSLLKKKKKRLHRPPVIIYALHSNTLRHRLLFTAFHQLKHRIIKNFTLPRASFILPKEHKNSKDLKKEKKKKKETQVHHLSPKKDDPHKCTYEGTYFGRDFKPYLSHLCASVQRSTALFPLSARRPHADEAEFIYTLACGSISFFSRAPTRPFFLIWQFLGPPRESERPRGYQAISSPASAFLFNERERVETTRPLISVNIRNILNFSAVGGKTLLREFDLWN